MSHLEENVNVNADWYFDLQGAKLKVWLRTKIAHEGFLIGCTVPKWNDLHLNGPTQKMKKRSGLI